MAVNGTSNNSASKAAYSYLQYKNKIGGLVSGMDIDSLMEKLMKAESAQMEKLQQQKQKYEWQRDAYRDTNLSLNTFKNDVFDKFGLSSSWTSKTVNSSSSKVAVTAGSTANGTLNISSATAAKTATSAVGQASIGAITNQRVHGNTMLSNIEGFSLSSTGTTSLDFSINGENKTIDVTANTTLDELKNSLNALKVTVNGVEKQAVTASVANGKISITSTNASLETTDTTTKNMLSSLGMLNNTTALGNSVKVLNDENNSVAITKETTLASLGLAPYGTLTFNVGDKVKTISYTAEDDTLGKLFAKINVESTDGNKNDPKLTASVNASGQISITSTLGFVTMNDSDARNKLGFVDKAQSGKQLFETTTAANTEKIQGTTLLKELGFETSGEFTLRALQFDGTMKDTVIKYESTDTINSLMSRISSSGAGVTALFNNGQMSISASNSGAAENGKAEVSLLANSANAVSLFNKLGASSTANTDGEITLADGGENSTLTVNGVEYSGMTNTFSVAGYSIQLNGDITAADNVSISSTLDVQSTVDKVKDFVGMYNTLIETLNSKTSEKKNVNYEPLTDAQKSEMTTDQITAWEEKAKAGLLRNDKSINSLLSKMRTILNSGSETNTLYNIGITTSKTWTDNGKLIIDEDKLRAAIEKNPDVLAKIFVGTIEEPGMISQMRKELTTATSNIESKAGKASSIDNQFSLGRTLVSIDDKINSWKDRLKGIEERYWKQFSAMETAIQKANNQSSIFSS